jgi:outer membrane lipoprotein-sorting protein
MAIKNIFKGIIYLSFFYQVATASTAFLPKSFSANLTQTAKESKILKKVKTSSGNIQYQYPGLVHLEIDKPDPIVYISNNDKTWLYRPPFIEGEKGETVIKEGKNAITQFFDSLSLGFSSNRFFDLKKNADGHLLTFKNEEQKNIGLKTALVTFKSEDIKFENISEIILIDLEDKKTTFQFSAIKLNPIFTADTFIFKEKL